MELKQIIKRRLGEKVIGFGSNPNAMKEEDSLLVSNCSRRFIEIWINSRIYWAFTSIST